jgi:hypothetical protein
MMSSMDEMLTWHKDSFDIFPVGKGWEMEVNEFDFADDGGVVYEKDGVKFVQWRQSHTEDGASEYRLNSLIFLSVFLESVSQLGTRKPE